jgi:hypothetical protein
MAERPDRGRPASLAMRYAVLVTAVPLAACAPPRGEAKCRESGARPPIAPSTAVAQPLNRVAALDVIVF